MLALFLDVLLQLGHPIEIGPCRAGFRLVCHGRSGSTALCATLGVEPLANFLIPSAPATTTAIPTVMATPAAVAMVATAVVVMAAATAAAVEATVEASVVTAVVTACPTLART